MKSDKHILVVGATGGVGQFICREIIRVFQPSALVVCDYKVERGQKFSSELGNEVNFRFADVHDKASLHAAIKGVDAVIVSVQQQQPNVQSVCLEAKVPCFDVALRSDFVEKVHKLNAQAEAQGTPSLVMSGLFPGLSGIIIKSIAERFSSVETIDSAFLQNVNGTAGPAGAADMLGEFSLPVALATNTQPEQHKGFTLIKAVKFPEPFGEINMRLINYDEADVIAQKLTVKAVNYWTAFNEESFNSLLNFCNRIKLLGLFRHPKWRMKLARLVEKFKQSNPDAEEVSMVIEVSGIANDKKQRHTLSMNGPSDYGATAIAITAMVKLFVDGKVTAKGVLYPLDVISFEALMPEMENSALEFFEMNEDL